MYKGQSPKNKIQILMLHKKDTYNAVQKQQQEQYEIQNKDKIKIKLKVNIQLEFFC